jgi:hypothetical protein
MFIFNTPASSQHNKRETRQQAAEVEEKKKLK